MRRARRTLAATVTLAVASTTLTGCFEEPSPHDAVRDFLVGWQTEDYELAAGRTDGDVATVRKALADAKLELDAASFRFKIKSISMTGDESKADFHAEVDLGRTTPVGLRRRAAAAPGRRLLEGALVTLGAASGAQGGAALRGRHPAQAASADRRQGG
ncbi:hypothetical protein ACFQ0B_02030 [Nonomuraea thailandensis]